MWQHTIRNQLNLYYYEGIYVDMEVMASFPTVLTDTKLFLLLNCCILGVRFQYVVQDYNFSLFSDGEVAPYYT